MRNICARYGLGKAMVQRLVSEWRIRAVGAGYIQDIHPEDLDLLIHMKDETELSLPGDGNAPHPQEVRLLPTGNDVMFSHTSV